MILCTSNSPKLTVDVDKHACIMAVSILIFTITTDINWTVFDQTSLGESCTGQILVLPGFSSK